MKKAQIFYLLIATIFFGITSCNDDDDGPDPDKNWDFANYSIIFDIEDEKLLNDDANLSKIKVTYNGKEFLYSGQDDYNYVKYLPPLPLAIRCYNSEFDKEKPKNRLAFGEFSPTKNYKGEKFTIDWGNGRVDNIEFCLFITWKKGDPTVHQNLVFNGETVDFAPISIPM